MPLTPQPAITHSTRVEDRVSLREKIGLGLGKIVWDGTHGTLHVLVNPVYNMMLGVNPALISTVVFIQRLWDAMLDPIVGQFSDNYRSKWGRRLPLLAVAIVPLALLFGALWWFPRGASESHLFWHLLLVSLAFYAAHSLFAMPLGGLMIEATDDYHERTRLAAFTMSCGFAFQIGTQWLFHVTQLPIFPDSLTGLRWVTVGSSTAFLIAGVLPILLCRERHYARVAARQPRVSLVSNLRVVRDNRPFLIVLCARFIASFGYNIVGMLGIYMNCYYVFGGDLKAASLAYGFLGSAFHVAAIVSSIFIYPRLTRSLGKKRTLQIAAGVLMVGCLSKLVVYHPGHPWLQLIVLSANGAANAGLVLVSTSMLGDIADYDELQTGLRREALYCSLMNWFEKAGNSFGSLLAGFVLLWIGFDAKLGPQSSHTLELMKFCYFIAPFTGAILALIIVQRYELSETRVYEIKAALAQRRALQGSEPLVQLA
jgi:GPH family glycoside/pentoside/hexuronide:cation symporter